MHRNKRGFQSNRGLRFFSAVMLTALLLLSSVNTAQAETLVGGTIASDTIWALKGSPYIVTASVEVQKGAALTIEPGVTIKFNPSTSLLVNGALIARGTAENPIFFTSNAAIPEPGDWSNIEFTDKATTTTMDSIGSYLSGSILQYCVVEYADGSANSDPENSAIVAHSLLIDQCTVQFNSARGIYMSGTESAPGRISNSRVVNNGTEFVGGGINARYCTLINNTINNNQGMYGGGIHTAFSILSNNRVHHNAATRGGGVYAYSSTVEDNAIEDNTSGSGGGIYADGGTVSNNTIYNNLARTDGGGLFANSSSVSGNAISANLANLSGGGIYANHGELLNNAVSDNRAGKSGGGVYVFNTTVRANTISENEVWADDSGGAGIYAFGAHNIIQNTIVGNQGITSVFSGGLEINGSPYVHDNNLYENQPFDSTIVSSNPVSGTHNYWYAASSEAIADQIYDGRDDGSRGNLLYTPFTQDLIMQAPLPPPLNLTADAKKGTIHLAWEAVPGSTTGWGYKVYYDSVSPLPPFTGGSAAEGPSPINVGAQTMYSLTGLNPNLDYFFSVTIYDTQGRESWYSKAIWKRSVYRAYLPLVNIE